MMKLLRNSILLLIALVSLMHVLGVFRFRQIYDLANATIGNQEKLPIFDTHVHYKEPAWEVYPPSFGGPPAPGFPSLLR